MGGLSIVFYNFLKKTCLIGVIVLKYLQGVGKMNIGDKIKKIRKNKGLTQSQFSEITGIAINSISRYEKGERKPTTDILKKIADGLNVDIKELFDDEASFSNSFDKTEQSLINDFRSLNENGQTKVVEYVKDLTENSKYKKQ